MATVVIVLPPGQQPAARTAVLRRLATRLERAGEASAAPTFPGTDDANLARFFQVDPSHTDAAELAAELAALPGVDGAYVKPDAEAP